MKLGKLVNFHFSLFHNFLWHTAIIFNFLCWRAFKVRQACGYTALNSSGELLYCNRGGNVYIVISTNWFGPQRWNWPTFLPKYATAHPITIFSTQFNKPQQSISFNLTESFLKEQFAGITTCCFEKHTCVKDWKTMQDRIYITAKWSQKSLKIRR